MNVKELMIGDWVAYIPEIEEGEDSYLGEPRNIQVDLSCLQKIDEIIFASIPLTPEILEKNGFYNRNTEWYYKRFLSNGCFDIATSLVYREIEVSKVCGVGTDCEEVDYGSEIVFGNNICVHQLQHVLRLCGLNDLADNFKV